MQFTRGFKNRLASATVLVATGMLVAGPALAQSVVVKGNSRVDAETIRSYFNSTDANGVSEGVKSLQSTGLFTDVRVSRQGSSVVVTVVENNIINRVAFEGNSKLKSEQLTSEIQTRSRGAYSSATVQSDIERIRDIYRRGGRGDANVTSRTVSLPNGRIDVVFTIDEGGKTGVKTINIVGNKAISSYRLRNLMSTTEMNYLSWLKTSDVYDPDKIASDQELIRRYYLKNGYADFRIVGSDAVYDAAQKGWIVNITVEEGAQYRVGSVNVESRLPDVDSGSLQKSLAIKAGDVYDGDQVEKTVEALTREVASRGYAFSSARPRGDRDAASHTIALGFVIEEGPRVYIERVNVRGNTRTREYVVRREFDLGEGDAYNRVLIDRAERRLNNLGFFKRVRVTNEPGSSPDRVVVNVDVEDQPTGSFAISGGYSTVDGIIGEVSLTESNFLGRGQFVRAALSAGQRTRGIDLSFTEPYLWGRVAGGVDLFAKRNVNSQYSLYDTTVVGTTLRLGLPITEEISFSPRYSIYQTNMTIPNTTDRPYNDCTDPSLGLVPGPLSPPSAFINTDGTFKGSCVTNGEASLAIKEAAGRRLTSLVGYTLSYNSLDNLKNPTQGLYGEIRQDIAGLGGDAKFVRSTFDSRYYYPLYEDIIGFARLQGGNITGFGGSDLRIIDNFNPGPSLVRGFAPGGIGPRDITDPANLRGAGLGGTNYIGGTLEAQFPIFGLPKELGLKAAVFADAGTVFGYKGRTNFAELVGLAPGAACAPAGTVTVTNPSTATYNTSQASCINVSDSHKLRSSIGASLLWASPLGPIRFDYAWAISKDKNDQTQAFRFSGGTSF
ncbi:MAG: bamA [Hyphomicrobiales bacterium]|nr:bamA [Hyphomicrobiales bacterium]